jgi:biopolymer transport protein ExbD
VTAPAGAGLEPADFEPIQIAIRTDGDTLRYDCDGQACDSAEMLKQRLRQHRAIADVEVIVTSDDSIVFNEVVAVLDLCYGCGFSKVGFAPEE